MKSNTIFIIAIIVLIIIGGAGYYITQSPATTDYQAPTPEQDTSEEPATTDPLEDTDMAEEDSDEGDREGTATERGDETIIGRSVEDRPLTAYHFGNGETELLFVGGLHGGYSFNTSLVGFELIDYLEANPDVVPENVTVTVLPIANPDGLFEVAGTAGRFAANDLPSDEAARIDGRFNANDVDLNRNFDREWEPEGTWQTRTVSGGAQPFSEPESQAIRAYVTEHEPAAVVAYYSAAGGVYSSSCRNGIDPTTADLTNTYAQAAGYPAFEEFDYYEITGDMVNWLASEDVPGISVLLSDHESTEWSKNRAGIEAVLNYFAE